MLYLTGYVGGKQYQDTLVSTDQLEKLFDLDLSERTEVKLRLNENFFTPETPMKTAQSIQALKLVNSYSGVYKGQQVTIHIAASVRNDNGTRKYAYPNANRVILNFGSNPTTTIDLRTNREMAVFVLLSTKCSTSPIKSPSNPSQEFRWEKPEVVQKAQAENIRRLTATNMRILAATNEQQKLFIAGLMAKRALSGVNLNNPDEVLVACNNLIVQDPSVLDHWDDESTYLIGHAYIAIENNNLLVAQSGNDNVITDTNGNSIVVISLGESYYEAIARAARSTPKPAEFLAKYSGVEYVEVPANLTETRKAPVGPVKKSDVAPQVDKGVVEAIRAFFNEGVLVVDPQSRTLQYKQGEMYLPYGVKIDKKDVSDINTIPDKYAAQIAANPNFETL